MPYFTTKKSGDVNRGMGLGLTICRRIVHFHGGNITLSSLNNNGTIVNIDLPYKNNIDYNLFN